MAKALNHRFNKVTLVTATSGSTTTTGTAQAATGALTFNVQVTGISSGSTDRVKISASIDGTNFTELGSTFKTNTFQQFTGGPYSHIRAVATSATTASTGIPVATALI